MQGLYGDKRKLVKYPFFLKYVFRQYILCYLTNFNAVRLNFILDEYDYLIKYGSHWTPFGTSRNTKLARMIFIDKKKN